MRPAAPPKPWNRDGIWYLIRSVPKEFAHLDRRNPVRLSTDIRVADDPDGERALPAVRRMNAGLEAYWRCLADGRAAGVRTSFETVRRQARGLGLIYRTNAELADGPLDEILRRLKLLGDRKTTDDEEEVSAVMGAVPKPILMLSGLVEEVEALQTASLSKYSENQKRKWRVPKRTAADLLIELVGDKAIGELTRDDALTLRQHWQDRAALGEVEIDTANKNMGRMAAMLQIVDGAHQLKLEPVFKNLRISGGVTKQRAAFDPDFVQAFILKAGALDSLNEEARHLVYLIAETGLRLSEAANLNGSTIQLAAEVPHVQVRPDGRVLKVPHTERDIPLVGAALEVMKLHPEGFPRYLDKSEALSAVVNNTLARLGLLPSEDHSLYSLRHTFEDRLTAVEAPEKVVASLMGHKWLRPKYGAGPSLEQKQRWLSLIAFTPPASL